MFWDEQAATCTVVKSTVSVADDPEEPQDTLYYIIVLTTVASTGYHRTQMEGPFRSLASACKVLHRMYRHMRRLIQEDGSGDLEFQRLRLAEENGDIKRVKLIRECNSVVFASSATAILYTLVQQSALFEDQCPVGKASIFGTYLSLKEAKEAAKELVDANNPDSKFPHSCIPKLDGTMILIAQPVGTEDQKIIIEVAKCCWPKEQHSWRVPYPMRWLLN
ncbi:hypothetical protein MMC30_007028 [Trapelia coarctata]|nr:hypothetical protein [Trapelia coarctata]